MVLFGLKYSYSSLTKYDGPDSYAESILQYNKEHMPSVRSIRIMTLINDIGNLRERIVDPLTPKGDVYKYTEELIKAETELIILERTEE
jgi:hypothetical protein